MNQANLNKLDVKETANLCEKVIQEVEKAVIGKRELLNKIMAALLTDGGHILLEDFPGLAKTLTANSFAKALGLSFKRIQFTPDLLPGDITGGFIFDHRTNDFVLRKGPIFSNILLADEINRASPKTQSALLEAMQEGQVSLEGETYPLPQPFIVIATQNPVEYEGTFPLPEAQMDRFAIRLSVGYPGMAEEQEMLNRRLNRMQDAVEINPVISKETLLAMRAVVEGVHVHADLQGYIVQLVTKTRAHKHTELGVSPRGSLALLKTACAWAVLNGRDFVIPDDIKTFADPVLSHRIIMNPNLWGTKDAEADLIRDVLQSVPVPVFAGDHEG